MTGLETEQERATSFAEYALPVNKSVATDAKQVLAIKYWSILCTIRGIIWFTIHKIIRDDIHSGVIIITFLFIKVVHECFFIPLILLRPSFDCLLTAPRPLRKWLNRSL